MPSRRSIFLSYRRQETSHLAGRLADRLFSQFGEAHVFMDVDSIGPGRDFAEAIERALNECAVLLALIGPTWTSAVDAHGRRRLDDPDDLVVLELQAALDRAIPVIPVLVDGATAPTRDDLPATLGALARRQALRIDHDTFRTDCAALLHHVARIVAEAGEQEATSIAGRSGDTAGITAKASRYDSRPGEEDREAAQQKAWREQPRQEQPRREPQARAARTQQALQTGRGLQEPAPQRRRNGRAPMLLGVLAVVAAGALIAAAILNLGPGTDREQPPAATAATATTAAPATPPVADDPVAVVQNYYALLPGNTDAAWALLGPDPQERSGGRPAYDRIWGELQSVTLQNVRQRGDSTVEATVVTVRQDGSTATELYEFVVGPGPDGRMIIQSFDQP